MSNAVSAPVSLDALRQELDRLGSVAYLVAVTAEGRPQVVAITTQWADDLLVLSSGDPALVDPAAGPAVTLLWPPGEWGYYSLIVDGVVVSAAEGGLGDQTVAMRPQRAVLRPATTALDGHPAAADCIPIYEPG